MKTSWRMCVLSLKQQEIQQKIACLTGRSDAIEEDGFSEDKEEGPTKKQKASVGMWSRSGFVHEKVAYGRGNNMQAIRDSPRHGKMQKRGCLTKFDQR